jgi:hypothetical protein
MQHTISELQIAWRKGRQSFCCKRDRNYSCACAVNAYDNSSVVSVCFCQTAHHLLSLSLLHNSKLCIELVECFVTMYVRWILQSARPCIHFIYSCALILPHFVQYRMSLLRAHTYFLSSHPESFKPFRNFKQLPLNSQKYNLSWEARSCSTAPCILNYSHYPNLQILFPSYSSYFLVSFPSQMKMAPWCIVIFLQTHFNFIPVLTCRLFHPVSHIQVFSW